MYTVVQSISTENKTQFKKMALFAFTGPERKYATNKLQMYISAAGGGPGVSMNAAVCNDNPIVENHDPPKTQGHTPPPNTTFPVAFPSNTKKRRKLP